MSNVNFVGNKCPNCSAELPLIGDQNITQCIYCGKLISQNERSYLNDCYDADSNVISSNSDSDVFAKGNWEELYKTKTSEDRSRGVKHGIILTNTEKLSYTAKVNFIRELTNYIKFCQSRKVNYYVIDLATQKVSENKNVDCENIVSILRRIYDVAVPYYLLVVGNHHIVPAKVWDNGCKTNVDRDGNIPSDLYLIALNTNSPFNGASYNFTNVTQVGRIPGSIENGMSESIAYFNNTKKFVPVSVTEVKSFILVAEPWSKTAQIVTKRLLEKNSKFYLSPPAGLQGVPNTTYVGRVPEDTTFIDINLHGAQRGYYYYGQRDSFYPEAFSPDELPKKSSGYGVVAQPCHGGKINEPNSTTVIALSNGAEFFVASTRIAYGSGIPGKLACGDYINQAFTNSVLDGLTTGKAFLNALNAVYSQPKSVYNYKTLAEFALYGDPSIVFVSTNNSVHTKSFLDSEVHMPCVIDALENEISLVECKSPYDYIGCKNISEKGGVFDSFNYMHELMNNIVDIVNRIKDSVNDFIKKNFKDFTDVDPKVYRLEHNDYYYAKVAGADCKNEDAYIVSYCKDEGPVEHYVHLTLNNNGKVINCYESR